MAVTGSARGGKHRLRCGVCGAAKTLSPGAAGFVEFNAFLGAHQHDEPWEAEALAPSAEGAQEEVPGSS
jgi:hypothetical protein